jgi:hypothetical protein
VNYYKVIDVSGGEVTGRNLFLGIEKQLFLLGGLEIPKRGDVVSGHWNYMLEVVDDWPELPKYQDIAKQYFETLKQLRKAVK